MKKAPVILVVLTAAGAAFSQTQPQPVRQTARQALIEMFISGKPGAMEKHLPANAKQVLGDMDNDVLQKLASFGDQLREGGRTKVETFDEGPFLVIAQDEFPPERRLEIAVERDSEQGGEDQIEVSPHMYRGGKPEPLPVVPRLTFTFVEDRGTWKLNDFAVLLRFPLGDAQFLSGLQQARQPALEGSAIGALRTLNTAEVTYAATYPQRGFTCKLAELGGSDQAANIQPSEHGAELIDSSLASGTRGGYTFSIQSCSGNPADRYQAVATPMDRSSGMRAFCSDESGVIRFSTDGDGESCLSSGEPLQ